MPLVYLYITARGVFMSKQITILNMIKLDYRILTLSIALLHCINVSYVSYVSDTYIR